VSGSPDARRHRSNDERTRIVACNKEIDAMRYALGTLAAIALLAAGSAVQASTHVTAANTPAVHSSKTLTFNGQIESVNFDNDTFVVRNERNGKLHEMEFKIEPDTWIKLDGQTVTLGQLERYDTVTVKYHPENARRLS
jgi:hypothetical protein